jgi:FtsP/CotA-like multicopper oxidase with cupredoxin domain
MESVKANGAPSAPQFSNTGQLIALAQEADAAKSVTYSFKANKPGTFLYESGSDPELQVQMGMFGTIIVKPAQAPVPDPAQPLKAYAYDSFTTQGGIKTQVLEPGSAYNRDKEYVLMLSEIDPDLHVAVEQKRVFKSDDYKDPYHARYFMINGRSFPDTIAPNDASWLPTQPYSALARVQPYDAKTNPLPAMLRYVSVGKDTYPFHPHSNHERIIGIDGRYLKDGNADLSSEKFGIVVTPGSTQDATFNWTNVEDYTASNIHVAPPHGASLTEGDFWNGTPFLGQTAQLNPGINQKTTCGEYYHVAHSHDLTQATNYGATFGGMLTLIRVDPPNNAACE